MGMGKLLTIMATGALLAYGVAFFMWRDLLEALLVGVLCGTILPYLVLRFLRGRRQKAFGAQFPDALDMIVRSLRAGHPVPIAINMVAREMPDPVGTEFGIVTDEITYGADLESALRNLYFRVGQDDLPLFVTAVAIQGSTGGNLGEILQNLSAVIRDRFKMRRKIRALAAEGRASALILSSLPIAIFAVIQLVSPDFYAGVWNDDLTKQALMVAGSWMGLGNFIMYRLVNFRI
jgi:tight adherence protein B